MATNTIELTTSMPELLKLVEFELHVSPDMEKKARSMVATGKKNGYNFEVVVRRDWKKTDYKIIIK